MSLCEKLKELKKEKNVTFKEISEKTDLTITELSMIFSGKRKPNVVSLKKIADALEVDYNYLYHGTDHKDNYHDKLANQQ